MTPMNHRKVIPANAGHRCAAGHGRGTASGRDQEPDHRRGGRARADRTVTVQGGATAADLLAATTPLGLVTATGVVRAVGMAGLTTAGGYGPLIGRYGLALDNLVGAEVILADGSTAAAGPDGDSELWWALRGGGGNFGVVTSLRYRMHRLPSIVAGMLMFPFTQARADPCRVRRVSQ
jgi:FAD/FMN-containing dehydrogenase